VRRLRCAVLVLPAEGGDTARAADTVDRAFAFGPGDFSEVVALTSTRADHCEALRTSAERAEADGFDWLLVTTACETLDHDVFVKLAPALRMHDAIWGGASRMIDGVARFERITRLAAQDLPEFFHAALRWWMGPTHFVRPRIALDALSSDAESWRADYWIALWTNARAYKTAQSLTTFHALLPELRREERARLVSRLEAQPVFVTVRFGPHTAFLPYTGLNPVLEREQMRGHFFEEEELRFLAGRMPRGMRIVDVGANTGNHTVFFALAMQAERVVPIEPHPRAVRAIRSAVEINRLPNIDLERLGTAVGAAGGRLQLVPSETAGLGATRFIPDLGGPIEMAPLDTLIPGAVDFVKIDVEGMEMDVLAGAAEVIERERPALFIEVLDRTVGPFLAWADAKGYRIEKVFPDKTHCNYLLRPRERT
jgi:FkbM family methyltransferase